MDAYSAQLAEEDAEYEALNPLRTLFHTLHKANRLHCDTSPDNEDDFSLIAVKHLKLQSIPFNNIPPHVVALLADAWGRKLEKLQESDIDSTYKHTFFRLYPSTKYDPKSKVVQDFTSNANWFCALRGYDPQFTW